MNLFDHTREEFIAAFADQYKQKREWISGGVTGGNCWGGEPNGAVEADPEPDDEYLTEIIEEVYPSLTFLQFRKLVDSGLYHEGSREVNEYYGNYYIYTSKTLMLDVLYDRLFEFAK